MKRLNNKGMAVVMALSVVLIMVTAALQLHINERDHLLNASAMRDRYILEQMTVSGVHLAMAVLIKDRKENKIDSVQEDWADAETMKTLLEEQIPFDNGALNVKIIDELGKVQINALVEQPKKTNQRDKDITEKVQFNSHQKKIWTRLADNLLTVFELLGEDAVDMEETNKGIILDSLKDWLDKDDFPEFNGAESIYYEELDPPYSCKNGPIDHISEIRLVKGVTPELFNGIGELGGMAKHVTVYGAKEKENQKLSYPGKININTAESAVLSLLGKEEGQDFAEVLVEFREATSGTQFTNDLRDKNWYKRVGADLDPELITYSSDYFRIIATAELNGVKTTTTAVVHREKKPESSSWQCKVLNWKTE